MTQTITEKNLKNYHDMRQHHKHYTVSKNGALSSVVANETCAVHGDKLCTNDWCFKATILHCKDQLGCGQLGLMR